MESNNLTDIFLPVSLFIIMLGMGLSLVINDFKRVLLYPKATLIGLFNQIILLPIFGFCVVILFNLPNEMAIGLMLLAACPGGVTSNLISHVSKGDTALSISLTAITSFITLISIPLIVSFSLNHFNVGSQAVEIDAVKMILQIFVIVIVPVCTGMLIRSRFEEFSLRMDKPVRIFSTVIFVVILLSIFIKEFEMFKTYFGQVGGAAIALNVSTMLLGYLMAKIFKLNLKQSITISIESGIQNGTLAIVIASATLGNTLFSIPAGIYSIVMFLTGGFMMYYFGKRDISHD